MEKGTAETFAREMDEWLNASKAKPCAPRLRLDPHTTVKLVISGGFSILLEYDDGQDSKSSFEIEKDQAIDLAHFILELFGNKENL